MDTFTDLFESLYNFSVFFWSIFKQYMVMNKQNAWCSHFFGPLGIYIVRSQSLKKYK